MTIVELMDAAKRVSNIPSDSALSRSLGLLGSSPTMWRKGKAFPSETSIVRLAELANESPAICLLRLRIEKAEPEARAVFEALLADLENTKTAA